MNKAMKGICVAAAALLIGALALNYGFKYELNAAIDRNDAGAVRKLVAIGADPNTRVDDYYGSALAKAAYLGQTQTVQVLLDAGASVKSRNLDGITPAMFAASASSKSEDDFLTIFDSLRLKGENLDERDSIGNTPLICAIRSCNPSAVRALLKLGVDANAVDAQKERDRVWLTMYTSPKVAAILRQHGVTIPDNLVYREYVY